MSPAFFEMRTVMGDLSIGTMVSIIDDHDGMYGQIGAVVFFDQKRNKILVRLGGVQQLYYSLEQLKEY